MFCSRHVTRYSQNQAIKIDSNDTENNNAKIQIEIGQFY